MSQRTPRTATGPLTRGNQGDARRLLTLRTLLAVVLVAVGIAWTAVYAAAAPGWMADLGRWNYVIGFGLILIGLGSAAHPSTPLGKGQGVVVGMLFCFLFGLAWILAYYFVGDHLADVPVMRDLGNYNLIVGIGFMAVGFTYATRWE
ncbi:MAG: cell division protein CrgA [Marmoricola sp.]